MAASGWGTPLDVRDAVNERSLARADGARASAGETGASAALDLLMALPDFFPNPDVVVDMATEELGRTLLQLAAEERERDGAQTARGPAFQHLSGRGEHHRRAWVDGSGVCVLEGAQRGMRRLRSRRSGGGSKYRLATPLCMLLDIAVSTYHASNPTLLRRAHATVFREAREELMLSYGPLEHVPRQASRADRAVGHAYARCSLASRPRRTFATEQSSSHQSRFSILLERKA